MRKIRVFICDDSRDLCAMVTHAVNRRDDMCVVGVAHDGMDALTAIRETRPDVLLLDLIMPRVDGIGVLETLRSEAGDYRPKVIVFSAVGADNLAQEVLLLGADYYVIKPFSVDMLCTRIWQVVHEPGTKPEASGAAADRDKVTKLLMNLGVPHRFKGFDCLREAILLVLEDEQLLGSVTGRLYPRIGERCGLSAPLVERNLRHLIEHTWTNGDLDRLYDVFGASIRANKGKPTNSSFIAKLADMVKMNQVSQVG